MVKSRSQWYTWSRAEGKIISEYSLLDWGVFLLFAYFIFLAILSLCHSSHLFLSGSTSSSGASCHSGSCQISRWSLPTLMVSIPSRSSPSWGLSSPSRASSISGSTCQDNSSRSSSSWRWLGVLGISLRSHSSRSSRWRFLHEWIIRSAPSFETKIIHASLLSTGGSSSSRWSISIRSHSPSSKPGKITLHGVSSPMWASSISHTTSSSSRSPIVSRTPSWSSERIPTTSSRPFSSGVGIASTGTGRDRRLSYLVFSPLGGMYFMMRYARSFE